MKIVVLDGYCFNPGDLNWSFLSEFGEYTIYDRTPDSLVIERARNADVVALNKTPVTREMLDSLPNLKAIFVLATGYNVVDTVACRERNIPVANIPSYSTDAVAQLVFAFILQFCNNVSAHSQSVHSGGWTACPDFSYTVSPLAELRGKTLGIIGYGTIGRQVAKIGKAFNMNVLATSRSNTSGSDDIARFTSRDEIIEKSDFLTIHTPLTDDTRAMVNEDFLRRMKTTAYLINTSRGPVVEESALRYALDNGIISGAAVDVLSKEPASADNPLIGAKNCLITPHIAWAPLETRKRLMDIFTENLRAYRDGRTLNVVN